MERSPVPRSELLHSRLRSAKADSKRQLSVSLNLHAKRDGSSSVATDGTDLWNFTQPRRSRATSTNVKTETESTALHTNSNVSDTQIKSSRRASYLAQHPPVLAAHMLGARETEEQFDKLTKQNFDLKLEVFHRRQKTEAMERRVQQFEEAMAEQSEHMTVLEEDREHLRRNYNEVLGMNDELLEELETRDFALTEAVNKICDLEEELEQERATRAAMETARQDIDGHKTDNTSNEKTPLPDDEGVGSRPPPSSSASQWTPFENQHGKSLFLLGQGSGINASATIYVDKLHSLRPMQSNASSLPRREGGEELQSMSASSDLGDSSSLPIDRSPQRLMKNSSPRTPLDLEARTARMKQVRTGRWVIDRALSPGKSDQASPTSNPDAKEFMSLDSILRQDGLPSSFRSPGQHDTVQRPTQPCIEDNAHSPQPTLASNTVPPTPETRPWRRLRHASPSIRPIERGLLRNLSLSPHRASGAVMPDDSPNTGGVSLTGLRSISPYEFAFYHDGSAFDTPPKRDRSEKNMSTGRMKAQVPAPNSTSRSNQHTQDNDASEARYLQFDAHLDRIPPRNTSANARPMFVDRRPTAPQHIPKIEPRIEQAQTSTEIDPTTPTNRRRHLSPASEASRYHHTPPGYTNSHLYDQPSQSEPATTTTIEEVLKTVPTTLSSTPRDRSIIPPRRTSSLRHHAATFLRQGSTSADNTPTQTPLKQCPSVAISTTRPVYSSVSARSEPPMRNTSMRPREELDQGVYAQRAVGAVK